MSSIDDSFSISDSVYQLEEASLEGIMIHIYIILYMYYTYCPVIYLYYVHNVTVTTSGSEECTGQGGSG